MLLKGGDCCKKVPAMEHQRISASLSGVEALEGVLNVLALNQINTFVRPARIPQLVNTKVICEQADP